MSSPALDQRVNPSGARVDAQRVQRVLVMALDPPDGPSRERLVTFVTDTTTPAGPFTVECGDRSASRPVPPAAIEALVGQGTVFVAPHGTDPTGATVTCWHAHWEVDGLKRPAEHSGHFESPEAAIEWGLVRTSEVVVRLRHDGEGYRYAGTGEPPTGVPVFRPGDR
jgi:hypothetical protein